CESPHWRLDGKVLLEFARPEHRALFGIQAQEVSLGAEGVDLALVNRRRRARPGGITPRVSAIVFVLPENGAVGFIEAKHAFAAGNLAASPGIRRILRVLRELAIHDVTPAICDGRSRVAPANGHAPTIFQAVRGELFEDARLPPDAIALRP